MKSHFETYKCSCSLMDSIFCLVLFRITVPASGICVYVGSPKPHERSRDPHLL